MTSPPVKRPQAPPSLIEAQQRIAEICRPQTERRALGEAAGFVLSRSVEAANTRPSRPVTAMDGYAVGDHQPPVGRRWRCVARSYPGAPAACALAPGEAVRVTTGAILPNGCARVVIDEDVQILEDEIVFRGPGEPKTHIRAAGSDFVAGERLVAEGARLTPGALIAAAAAEATWVEVFRRPRLGLVTIGDELLIGPGHENGVPDTLTIALTALARSWGAGDVAAARSADAEEPLMGALSALKATASVLVTVGAASGSDRDNVRRVAERLGARILFAGVALKPGKPAWAAVLDDAVVIGLPGNPAAALVAARLLLVPALQILSTGTSAAADWRLGALGSDLAAGGPREEALRARSGPGGLEILPRQDSASQAALAAVTALVRREAGAPARQAGELVSYAPLEP
jgi:molybdopterin molybdotransferase